MELMASISSVVDAARVDPHVLEALAPRYLAGALDLGEALLPLRGLEVRRLQVAVQHLLVLPGVREDGVGRHLAIREFLEHQGRGVEEPHLRGLRTAEGERNRGRVAAVLVVPN
jgi:hypothetical protein